MNPDARPGRNIPPGPTERHNGCPLKRGKNAFAAPITAPEALPYLRRLPGRLAGGSNILQRIHIQGDLFVRMGLFDGGDDFR